jgi:hypothetical protein
MINVGANAMRNLILPKQHPSSIPQATPQPLEAINALTNLFSRIDKFST